MEQSSTNRNVKCSFGTWSSLKRRGLYQAIPALPLDGVSHIASGTCFWMTMEGQQNANYFLYHYIFTTMESTTWFFCLRHQKCLAPYPFVRLVKSKGLSAARLGMRQRSIQTACVQQHTMKGLEMLQRRITSSQQS